MILDEAIKQTTFKSMQVRASVNLYYTQAQLHHYTTVVLKPFDISVQQFNVLRILKGQQGKPIALRDITKRMVDQMSNTSRLIEKMRIKGLVDRVSCPSDRRKVELTITKKGVSLVEEASEVVNAKTIERFRVLTEDEVSTLNKLLDKLNQL